MDRQPESEAEYAAFDQIGQEKDNMPDIQFDDELQELRFDCGYNGYDEFTYEPDEEIEVDDNHTRRARAFYEEHGAGDSVDALIDYKDALEERLGSLMSAVETINTACEEARGKGDQGAFDVWNVVSEVFGHNICDGCSHCEHAGIRWPASPDGFNDLSYVDRCDYCERYESDETAVKFLAEHYGVRWGYAYREAVPKTDADIRWEPEQSDPRDYTGWSAFIDRPERDG